MLFENDNIEIITNNSKVVISKDNIYNFKEVVEDIDRGKHLFISTFNYYMDSSINKNLIQKIEHINDIRVIVNLYDNSGLSKIINKAREMNPFIQMYYCENNHSKIISTGNKMYIGSANYTGYSKENFEVGVVINDKKAIEEIEKRVFNGIFNYFPIIYDPIQPLIILFIQIIYFESNNLNSLDSLYNNYEKGRHISEDDLENADYDFLEGFAYVYSKILHNIKKYIKDNGRYFSEEGCLLENFIEQIDKKFEELSKRPLGSYTDSTFDGFCEDYRNCGKQYKDIMLREEIVKNGVEGKEYERFIFSKYQTFLNMLLYFRVRWIKEYSGPKIEHIICKNKCVRYLTNLHDLDDLIELSSNMLS